MELLTFSKLWDYTLLDSGDGYRLEQWGDIRLARPDPQIIWPRHLPDTQWGDIHARYVSRGEKGHWEQLKPVPASWIIHWNSVSLRAKLTPFKHTGIFAEQAANWEWMSTKLKPKSKVLNLFGYTGAASVVLAKAGHFITHVDASKPAIAWAKDNQNLNKLPANSIRWMLDDAAKFVQREVKRAQTYDGIVMDPPAFGHSPSGKTWKFNADLPHLLKDCVQLLSPKASFLLINGYATNSSAISLGNLLEDAMGTKKGTIENGELCLEQSDQRLISTGIFARWSA
jgi:23S rRNA (cytosine1962-C5)-methyltransferase